MVRPTLAGALDHIGIFDWSVNKPQISSALACRSAWTSTTAVEEILSSFSSVFFSAAFDALSAGGAGVYFEPDPEAIAGVDAPEAGDAEAGSPPDPWAETNAGRKALNFSVRSGGSEDRTIW